MKKVVLSLAFVALMFVSCKEAATEEVVVEETPVEVVEEVVVLADTATKLVVQNKQLKQATDSLIQISDSLQDKVEILETKAIDVSETKLNEELGSGYGIFSGKEVKWATLKFTPERARWTASERWHSKQIGKYLDDGSYELKVPYSKEPELIIDIMKYGPDVEVTAPEDLRKKIQATNFKITK